MIAAPGKSGNEATLSQPQPLRQRLAEDQPLLFAVQEAALADQLDEMGGRC